MTSLTAFGWLAGPAETVTWEAPRKPDWALMSDVSTIRAGVPDALIRWRAARGETAPEPCDPDLIRRQNSL